MGLDGNIKIPGAGELPKKYVLAAAGVSVAIVTVVVIRKRKAAAAASAAPATAGQVTDPSGNVCAILDPNSGYCPGSPEDTAYQESATGNLSDGLDFGGSGTGTSLAGLLVSDPAGNQCTAVNPATGYCPGTPQDVGTSGGGGTGTGVITTNSAWISEALTLLPGGATSANEAALAGVLAGTTVTTAQLGIFNSAVALAGPPPQGYPTPIKTSDTSGQPGGGGVVYAANPPQNLHMVRNGKTGVQIQWNPVKNSKSYTVDFNNSKENTTNTIFNIGSLKAGTRYSVEVWANPTPTGGPHATLGFTTLK